MRGGLKNYLNMAFSLGLMMVMGVLIVKGQIANHHYTAGYIEYFECFNDKKTEATYQYNLKLASGQSFRNRIKVPCDVLPEISKEDYVEIESIGHIFIQITFNEVELFDKSYLESRRSSVNLVFILLFLLGLFDFSYRMFNKVKNRNATST